MGVHLANVPENWIFDTSRFSNMDIEKTFKAIRAEKKQISSHEVLITPNKGHEDAVRIICTNLFRRVKNGDAKKILSRKKSAT